MRIAARLRGIANVVVLLLASSASPIAPASTAPAFRVSRVDTDVDIRAVHVADLDGDGRRDILLCTFGLVRGRELLVLAQSPEGGFPVTPTRRIDVKSDIVALSLADVREEPGDELLLWTRSGGFSFTTSRATYAGNARRLLRWDLLADVPDRRDVFHLGTVRDLDGDGAVELLLPSVDSWGLFRRGEGSEGWELSSRLDVGVSGSRPRSSRESRFEVRAGTLGLREEGEEFLIVPEGGSEAGALLDVDRWVPAPALVDVDGDGRRDVVLRRGDPPRLDGWRVEEGGSIRSEPDWTASLPSGGLASLRDIDGDGRADLLVMDESGTKDPSLRFHRGTGAGSFSKEPVQVLKLSGYASTPELVDLDGDRRPELVVTTWDIPLTGALGGGRVDRRLLIFRREPDTASGRFFERRVSSRFEETFTAKEFKGMAQRVTFEAVLTDDGRPCALRVDRDGSVVAQRVGGDLEIEAAPFWRHVPSRWVTSLSVERLDGDARSDLVLRHHRGLTILVSGDRR